MKKPRRILVGLKTLRHARDLTDLACRVAARQASVVLIHVIELPDVTPLDAETPELEAEARHILKAGERVVKQSGLKVESHVFRSHSAGEALLDEMRLRKTDLAVLGYHHRRSIGEILLGTTAQHLARRAPCELLVHVPPRE